MIKLKKEDEEKIVRYLDGLADNADREAVETFFGDGESNRPLKLYLEEDWSRVTAGTDNTSDGLQHILDHIHHDISLNKYHRETKAIRRLSGFYARVAAILLLPLLAFGGYLFFRDNSQRGDQEVVSTIYAPKGSRVAFTLPDGTSGMLNSGSYLTYRTPFIRERNISLQGEAWLDVTHDEKHPFRIAAGDLSLTVLGTSFNVNAYPDEQYVEVVLEEGRVSVTSPGEKEPVIMHPSERLVYQSGNITMGNADPSKYSSWKEGKLVFRGDTMAEVARRLERWYNVNVELKGTEIEKYSFRGTFEDDQLEEVLHYLCMTSPLKYVIIPRKIMADGTYSKITVIVSHK